MKDKLTNDNLAALGIGLLGGASVAWSPLMIPILLGVALVTFGVYREMHGDDSASDSQNARPFKVD